jgi:uncharacterized protein (UPF0332 family)
MNLSQLKEQVRNILRERSVKAIQKEYSNVVDDIQKHLELYKKSKGTPEEKKHVGHLKTLGEKKKKLQVELDLAVAGLYKNAELKVDEAITNPKKTNPSDLAKTVLGWFDFYTDYIDDGGQRRRAIKSNDDVLVWFGSHPKDVKEKAYKIMLSQSKSEKGQVERTFGKHLNESVNESKTYKKGDKLKIKLPNGKKFDVVFVDYSGTKGIAFGKFKIDGEVATKPFSLSSIVESVNESDLKGYLVADVVDDIVKSIGSKFVSGEIKNAPNRNYIYLKLTDIKFGSGVVKMLKSQFGIDAKIDKTFGNIPSVSFASKKVVSESVNESTEPEVISQLRDIVKNKQYQDVKDPSSGKKMKVDMQTANTVLKIYDGLSNVNKQNMVKMGLPKMIDVSNKIINKYKK